MSSKLLTTNRRHRSGTGEVPSIFDRVTTVSLTLTMQERVSRDISLSVVIERHIRTDIQSSKMLKLTCYHPRTPLRQPVKRGRPADISRRDSQLSSRLSASHCACIVDLYIPLAPSILYPVAHHVARAQASPLRVPVHRWCRCWCLRGTIISTIQFPPECY
jgi:hypothetical protein